MGFIVFLSILISIITSSSDIYSCPRVRKAWHLISDEERQQFISGIHKLNEQGKIKHFGLTHHHIVDSAQAHLTAEFFAWHRYLLWEVLIIDIITIYPYTLHTFWIDSCYNYLTINSLKIK